MQCSIQRANNQLSFVTGRGSGQWVNFAARQILLLGFPIRNIFLFSFYSEDKERILKKKKKRHQPKKEDYFFYA